MITVATSVVPTSKTPELKLSSKLTESVDEGKLHP